MPFPILPSKLFIPRPAALIARPHLFERLNEGLTRKLLLVAAQPGAGKTSVVSAWLREIDVPAAWLSLDVADNDPNQFVSYLVAACQKVEPLIGQTVPDLLHAAQPQPPLKTIMTHLINDFDGTPAAGHYLLVLDDYHLIEDFAIHEAMRFLLDHLPARLHLVLITREDPPFPLPQLRVRRQMIELRAIDLRFSSAEVAEFFRNTAAGANLSAEDVLILERRTEGWVAGLQLAALSLQNVADPAGFIKAFAGDDRYVVDYLLAEVLERQPEHVLNFLQKTSILARFTAGLCQAVTGQANAQEILAYLEEANLFLVALDNRRAWYRYHHLFADLLRHRLRQTAPTQIPRLHRLASRWYQAQSLNDEAIDHALAGQDYDHAAELIEQEGLKMVGQARLNQLERWIGALPASLPGARSYLAVLQAWISVLNARPDKAEVQLASARDGRQHLAAGSSQRLELDCQLALLQGYVSRFRQDLLASLGHIKQAVQFLPPANEFLQCTVYLNLGGTSWVLGNFAEVEAPLRRAVAFLDVDDTTYPALVAAGYLTNTYLQRGQLGEAAKLCRHVEQKLPARRRLPPAYAYLAIEQGALYYEQNNLAAATSCLSQAVQLGENLDQIVNIGRALLVLAWIKQLAGQTSEAAVLLARASAKPPPSVAEFNYQRVRLWLMRGDRGAAGAWAEAYKQQRGIERPWQALNALTFAHILLADQQLEQALEVAAECETAVRMAGTTGWLIRSLAFEAVCRQAAGDTDQALLALEQALDLAEPEGYLRTFIDHGQPMERLLRLAASQGIAPAYTSRLLAAFPGGSHKPPKSEIQTQGETLNEREQSILRLMAAGLSNREIASELYLSTNTIKWYSSQIYGKLGVKKRAEAVDRAHDLGLL